VRVRIAAAAYFHAAHNPIRIKYQHRIRRAGIAHDVLAHRLRPNRVANAFVPGVLNLQAHALGVETEPHRIRNKRLNFLDRNRQVVVDLQPDEMLADKQRQYNNHARSIELQTDLAKSQ